MHLFVVHSLNIKSILLHLSAAREGLHGREEGGRSEQLERVLRVRGVTLLGLLYGPAGVHQQWCGEGTKQGERVMVTSTEMHFIHSDFFLLLLPLLLLLNLLADLALELLRQHEKLFT